MQRSDSFLDMRPDCFNPHPPREADATGYYGAILALAACFNPHPPREADAIAESQRRRCNSRFNPHPPREADATGNGQDAP